MKKEVLSDAEQDYLMSLKNMREQCDKFDSAIDKLIVKKNYQETQVILGSPQSSLMIFDLLVMMEIFFV